MEFPADRTVIPKDNFDLAVPRIEGLLTMELLAELRPSGRVLDPFRISVGGTKLLNVETSLFDFIPLDTFKGWRFKADIGIRRNLTSSAWIDGLPPRRLLRRDPDRRTPPLPGGPGRGPRLLRVEVGRHSRGGRTDEAAAAESAGQKFSFSQLLALICVVRIYTSLPVQLCTY